MSGFVRRESGQTLVEFAILLPLILLIVVGLFDLARAVWQENTLAYAAREGTRFAIVHGSGSESPVYPGNEQPVVDVVRRNAIGLATVSVGVTWPDTLGGSPCLDRNCRVAVDATAPFAPALSQYLLNGALTITLRGGSMLVIQR